MKLRLALHWLAEEIERDGAAVAVALRALGVPVPAAAVAAAETAAAIVDHATVQLVPASNLTPEQAAADAKLAAEVLAEAGRALEAPPAPAPSAAPGGWRNPLRAP